MAGWTQFPATAGSIATSASGIWAELYAAWNERRAILGQSAETAPSAGSVMADKDWLQDIQSWIESYCGRFVDPSATIEGEEDMPVWTSTSLLNELPSGGWRKKNDGGATTGQAAAGDYASYIHAINDVQEALNLLTHYLIDDSYTGDEGTWNSREIRYGQDTSFVDYATAKTGAESNYSAASFSSTSNAFQFFTFLYGDSPHSARLQAMRAYPSVDRNQGTVDCNVTIYLKQEAVTGHGLPADSQFSQMESPYASDDEWFEWETISAHNFSTDGYATATDRFPKTSPAQPSPWPPDPALYGSKTLGFQIPRNTDYITGICNYAISGGFTYY